MLKLSKWSLLLVSGSGLAALIAPEVARAQAPQPKEDEQKLKDNKQTPRKEGERPKSGPPSAQPPQKKEIPPAAEKKSAPPPVPEPKVVPPAVEKKVVPPVVPKQVTPVLPPKEAPPAAEKKAAPPPPSPPASVPPSVPKQVTPLVVPPKEAPPAAEKKAAPVPPEKAAPPVVTQPATPKQVPQQTAPPTVVQPPAGSVPPPTSQPVLPPQSGQPGAPLPKQLTPSTPVQPGTSPIPPKSVEGSKEANPPSAKSVQPAPVPAPAPQGALSPAAPGGPVAQPKVGAPVVNPVVAVPVAGPKTIEQVRQGRVESVGEKGQTIIKEPGDRTIIKQDNRVFITRNETTVIQNLAPNAQTTVVSGGISQTVYQRPDGARVFSEVDGNGRLLRRYRRDAQDRETVFVDNRKFYRNLAIGVGIGIGVGAIALALAPPVVALPRTKYIVDYDRASDDDLYEALSAPPVVKLERNYSLDEIRYSEPLRARVRRVDLDTITFQFGSFEVTPDQHPRLERVARAIGRSIERNPAEVFMIEGHTDAVGADVDNLSLSDRRAESVARILTQYFSIPIENLVTQGYGEQFLKVPVQTEERANRRVAVRRITDLLSQEDVK